jgi:ATP-dependent helicase YprA (DUF1998 family)
VRLLSVIDSFVASFQGFSQLINFDSMRLTVLLLAQQCLSTSSYSSNLANSRISSVGVRPLRFLMAQNTEPEFMPLGDINTKSTIDRDTFLFGEKVSFSSCGIGAELTSALEATGKFNPTSIQAKTFTAIATGQDVIVGAETGSGKTLSYLLPILQRLLDEEKEETEIDETVVSMYEGSYPSAIIMVPNKELCAQVYRMANELTSNMPEKHNITVGTSEKQSISNDSVLLIMNDSIYVINKKRVYIVKNN